MTSQDMRIRSSLPSLPSTSLPQLGYKGRPVGTTIRPLVAWLSILIVLSIKIGIASGNSAIELIPLVLKDGGKEKVYTA